MLQIGDIIEGKYKILEKIGQGGMSKVWLAMDMSLNKQWAVKEINKNTEEYKKTVNEHKTRSEIEIMKRLSHPSLPRIVSVTETKDALCIVMDYIEGESLDKILKMYGPQPESQVVPWVLEICDILNYLHHQDPPIIYRDMKPHNVMLSQEGNIKIIDFGIAREYKSDRNDTVPLGTRGYASPEHFVGKTDVRSDVYSIGATMYSLLTGLDPRKPPYEIRRLRDIDKSFSTGLDKIIDKATQLDPNNRYQSVQELANAISSYKELDDQYIEKLNKKIKKTKHKFTLSVMLIVIGVVLSIGGEVLKNQNYNALMNSTTLNTEDRAGELEKAIALDPSKEDAYIELIKVFSSDGKFTEEEASKFTIIYSEFNNKIQRNKKNYAYLNYMIGEAFLKYYTGETDHSSRAKLIAAEPYFKAASENNKFEKHTLAEQYVFLSDYYKTYVLADDSLLTEEGNKDKCTELLKNCKKVIKELESYEGSGKNKMEQITYQVILNLIDSQRGEMAKEKVPKASVLEVISLIENEVSNDNIEIINLIASTREGIEISYNNMEKKEDKRT